jgi:hypothetical protein
MRPRPAALLALALAAALGACATLPAAPRAPEGPALPRRAEVPRVPFFPQERYACGPAALAMALAWTGLPVTAEAMVPQVYTPGREGTLRTDILAAARRHGRLAVPVTTREGLLRELAAGHPVLVFQNLALAWFPRWHFAVAVGYDLDAGEVVLRSGLDERRRTPFATFERTWARGDRWALVILPPERLPATADERAVVGAAAGLERARRFQDAATAYAAALARWPDSFVARIGLGNARYGLADFAGAEAAFREAAERRPGEPAAWNNLAHALHRQGRTPEALAAARTAVRLAGAHADPYRTTLQELSEGARSR